MTTRWPWTALLLGVCLSACDGGAEPGVALAENAAPPPTSAGAVCRVAEAGMPLPDEVRETSGLARSRRDPGVFWTHNDRGNEPVLFAVDGSGSLVGRVTIAGADLEDWEDVEAAGCPEGDCLYVGDIGDNDGERESITVYRVAEPDAGAPESAPATALRGRFPDGPRDAESLFVLPSGEVFVVTKGRDGPIALYRFPTGGDGETLPLERVREIGPEPSDDDDRVTAAAASPDGRWVGIRSYRTLFLYSAADLVGGGPAEAREIDLRPLDESQGEGLAIADDGTVWLTSEAENKRGMPRLGRLQCSLNGDGA